MLFLFSDVSENDAPTRIRVGSPLRIPQLLLTFELTWSDGDYSLVERGIRLDFRNRPPSFKQTEYTGVIARVE